MKSAVRLHPAQQGFTLIEILVVVVIIGILLSVTVALRGDHSGRRTLMAEAERFQSVFALAQSEASRNGLPLRLAVDDTGYRFEVFTAEYAKPPAAVSQGVVPAVGLPTAALKRQPDGQWQKPELNALTAYRPDRPVRFHLAQESAARMLVIMPDGMTQPFTLILTLPDDSAASLRLKSDGVSAPDFE